MDPITNDGSIGLIIIGAIVVFAFRAIRKLTSRKPGGTSKK